MHSALWLVVAYILHNVTEIHLFVAIQKIHNSGNDKKRQQIVAHFLYFHEWVTTRVTSRPECELQTLLRLHYPGRLLPQ